MAEERRTTVLGPDDPVRSPCLGVCELDARFGLCRGCLRSADEIMAWRDAGDTVRRQILERVNRRRHSGYLVGTNGQRKIIPRSIEMSKI